MSKNAETAVFVGVVVLFLYTFGVMRAYGMYRMFLLKKKKDDVFFNVSRVFVLILSWVAWVICLITSFVFFGLAVGHDEGFQPTLFVVCLLLWVAVGVTIPGLLKLQKKRKTSPHDSAWFDLTSSLHIYATLIAFAAFVAYRRYQEGMDEWL